jgi:hypothetical protein
MVQHASGVNLAPICNRSGAPYPVFLAVGGALLAFLPGAPPFSVPPELALALFVAPVLLAVAKLTRRPSDRVIFVRLPFTTRLTQPLLTSARGTM